MPDDMPTQEKKGISKPVLTVLVVLILGLLVYIAWAFFVPETKTDSQPAEVDTNATTEVEQDDELVPAPSPSEEPGPASLE